MILPTTAGGWAVLIVGVLTIITILGGAGRMVANWHIDSRIRTAMSTTICGAISEAIKPLVKDLGDMKDQMKTNTDRLGQIGVKIENGLEERQGRIEDKVDRILEHYAWNGDERRNAR